MFTDTISFDAYNEGTELQEQVESYKSKFGFYPNSVHADQIYRNQKNRKFCKDNGIRLSGPKLGRPSKSKTIIKGQKAEEYKDQGIRNIVESKFGIAKRRYGLNKIMTKLPSSSKTVIALIFMVMNLDNLIYFLALYSIVKTMIKKYLKAFIVDKLIKVIDKKRVEMSIPFLKCLIQ